MKKILSAIILLLIAVAIVSFGWFMGRSVSYDPKIDAAMSVKGMTDTLYTMEYRGDYGFDAFLMEGGADTSEKLADWLTDFILDGKGGKKESGEMEPHGCSTLVAEDTNGNALYGRNYDWNCGATIVTHTVPENGYESVATTALEFLGNGKTWVPRGFTNKVMAEAAIYIPMDGMNEKGLFIADLFAGDNDVTHQDTGKADLTSTSAIRLVLDKAATVDEAIALLKRYDMHSDIGTAHHYAIADKSGRSVVVEYIDGEMVVSGTQVVTNHYLSDCPKQGKGTRTSQKRYDKLMKAYEENGGVFTVEEMEKAMRSVSQKNMHGEWEMTRWSCVYEPETLTVHMFADENWAEEYSIRLGEDKWFKKVRKD